jgi:hypothetical protein
VLAALRLRKLLRFMGWLPLVVEELVDIVVVACIEQGFVISNTERLKSLEL